MKTKGPRVPKNVQTSTGYLPPNLSWLPDWKKYEEYQYLESASLKQFAWEFLRRNRHYRNLREDRLSKFVHGGHKKLIERAESLLLVRNSSGSFDVSNDHSDLKKFHEILFGFHSTFGLLNFPPDPENQYPEVEFETCKIIVGSKDKDHVQVPIEPNEVICVFDLKMPITDSFKEVKKQLKAMQPEKNIHGMRARPEKYIQYLRVHDANIRRIKNDDIAKVLHPNLPNHSGNDYRARNLIQENHTAAKKLIDGGYKFLAAKAN